MKRMLFTALVATVLAAPLCAVQAADINLKMLSGWDEKYQARKFAAEEFISRVQKASDGRIGISISGPEVVPPFEQLQPVSAGVFDLLFTHGVYHFGSKGLALAFDVIDPDPAKRRSAGLWKMLDEHYQKNANLKLIGLFTTGSYGIVLREPLTPEGDWKGRKIRGTKTYHGVIRALGGSPVVLPGGEIYSALEKGVVDGAAWPSVGPLDFKWYEVAKYRVRPTFGTVAQPILMNLDRFNKLSPEDRKLLLDVAEKLEPETIESGERVLAEEDAKLDDLGMKVTELPPEQHEKVAAALAKSMWEVAAECCGEAGKRLHELAAKNGMTK